jgi:23S rRNA (guanosine2251-2'-O)-methyltransferase
MTHEHQTDILYGVNPVIEALRAGKRKAIRLYLSDSRHDKYEDMLRHLAKGPKIPVNTVTKQELSRLTSTESHQGIAGRFEPYPYSDIQSMLDTAAQRSEKPFIVALDELQDPHNTGAAIRTASCFGMHGVVLTKRRSAEITPAVVKSSSGATEYMHVAMVSNLRAEIESLKESGLTAVGLDMQGQATFNTVTGENGIVLIVGSEGSGIRKPVLDVCDYTVSIPMKGHPNSLNASVSAGIAIYTLNQLLIKKYS